MMTNCQHFHCVTSHENMKLAKTKKWKKILKVLSLLSVDFHSDTLADVEGEEKEEHRVKRDGGALHMQAVILAQTKDFFFLLFLLLQNFHNE